MDDRVKEFVSKHYEESSLVLKVVVMCIFFQFDFLKIHYLTSNLDNYMNDKIKNNVMTAMAVVITSMINLSRWIRNLLTIILLKNM